MVMNSRVSVELASQAFEDGAQIKLDRAVQAAVDEFMNRYSTQLADILRAHLVRATSDLVTVQSEFFKTLDRSGTECVLTVKIEGEE